LGFFGQKIVSFAAELGVNLHFMKVSTEIDNNFGYEKITQLVDNIPLIDLFPPYFIKLCQNIHTKTPLKCDFSI
jgi:hypothetical protein